MYGEQSVAESYLRRNRRHICRTDGLGNFWFWIGRPHRRCQCCCGRAAQAWIFLGRDRVRCNRSAWRIDRSLRRSGRRWSWRVGSRGVRPDYARSRGSRHNLCPVNRITARLAGACCNAGLNLSRVLLAQGRQAEQHAEAADCQGKSSHHLCRVLLTLTDFTPHMLRTVDETILAEVIFVLLRMVDCLCPRDLSGNA